MIKKTLLPLLFSFAAILNTMGQSITNGFYRVNNFYTKRYVYVYDNYGSINVSTTSADMGAIVLQKDAALRYDDPASVIYVSNKGKYNSYDLYDLEAQGTGVYKIISYYVTIVKNSTNKFSVYEPSHSMYLYDGKASTAPRSYMQTSKPSGASNDIGYWSVTSVNAATDEYLGITPHESLKVGNKYYKPYYLGFAFDFASTGMKAYYISEVKSDAVIISEVQGTVPAGTPVIVECSSTNCSNNRINVYATSPATIADNKLSGNYFCYEGHATSTSGYKEYDPTTMRLLSVVDGHLTYITDTSVKHHTPLIWMSGGKETKRLNCLNANESYLKVAAGTADKLPVMTKEEYEAAHPVHNHQWSSSWTHNDTHHWHTCTSNGCPITDYASCGEAGAAYGAHTYGTTGDSRFTCVCGYVDNVRKNAAEIEDKKNNHRHEWNTAWTYNATNHWHTCVGEYCSITDYASCGEEGAAYGVHTYGTTGDSRFTCVCGYVDNSRKSAAELEDKRNNHQHEWNTAWTYNDTHHWHTCIGEYCSITDYATCDESGAAYSEHFYGETGTSRYICVCGFVDADRKAASEDEDKTENHEHDWNTAWTYNTTGHWHTCIAEYCDISDYSTCSEEGAAYAPHSYGESGTSRYICLCGYLDETRKAQAALDDDKALFAQYQGEKKDFAETLADSEDPVEITSLIDQALADIDDLVYDEELSLEDNKKAVDAIINQLISDIETTRIAIGIFSPTHDWQPARTYNLHGRYATEQRGIRIESGRKKIR